MKLKLILLLVAIAITQVASANIPTLNLIYTLTGYYVPSVSTGAADEDDNCFYPQIVDENDYIATVNIYDEDFNLKEAHNITIPKISGSYINQVQYNIKWLLPDGTRFIAVSYSSGGTRLISFSGEIICSLGYGTSMGHICNNNGKYYLVAYHMNTTSLTYQTLVYKIECDQSSSLLSECIPTTASSKKTFDINGIPVENPKPGSLVISIMEDGKTVKSINH